MYPHYNDLEHGFTYNGHTYIAFFVMLSLAVTFGIYRRFKITDVAGAYVAPLFFLATYQCRAGSLFERWCLLHSSHLLRTAGILGTLTAGKT